MEINIDAADIEPMITYGTNPGMGLAVTGSLPTMESFTDATEKQNYEKALKYMGLTAGQSLLGHASTKCIHWILYEFKNRRF